MEALRTFQILCVCWAESVAGGTGGGCEELSVDAACAHSVLTASWALMWSLLCQVIFSVPLSSSLQ